MLYLTWFAFRPLELTASFVMRSCRGYLSVTGLSRFVTYICEDIIHDWPTADYVPSVSLQLTYRKTEDENQSYQNSS